MNLIAEQTESLGSITQRWIARALLAVVVSVSGVAFAQSDPGYPSRPIKIIVPFVPGGPNDIAARLVAPHLAERLKTPVIVTNIGGAGGRIGSKAVTTSPADGYTIMIGGTNLNVVIPAIFKGLDYDPVKDFVPVGAIATDTMLLAIHPGLPVKSVAEFVQYSKSHPGTVNAGSAPGIGPHFVIELFKLRTGADMTFVPYKGAALAIQDTLGGHVAMTVTNKAVLMPLIQKNQLRALAVTSPSRMADLPDVPTLKESGVLGVPSINWYGLLAPAATPPAVVSRLQSALREVGKLPAVLEGIRRLGLEPEFEEDFGAALAGQRREWAVIAKETRITLE